MKYFFNASNLIINKTFLFSATMVFKALRNFCESTSIHGLVFIADKNISTVKRGAWLIIFLTSISYAMIKIKESVDCEYTYIFTLFYNFTFKVSVRNHRYV